MGNRHLPSAFHKKDHRSRLLMSRWLQEQLQGMIWKKICVAKSGTILRLKKKKKKESNCYWKSQLCFYVVICFFIWQMGFLSALFLGSCPNAASTSLPSFPEAAISFYSLSHVEVVCAPLERRTQSSSFKCHLTPPTDCPAHVHTPPPTMQCKCTTLISLSAFTADITNRSPHSS